MSVKPKKDEPESKHELESYFKIGVDADYILLRDDFPIKEIPPGEFKKLIMKMFMKNDEALHGK